MPAWLRRMTLRDGGRRSAWSPGLSRRTAPAASLTARTVAHRQSPSFRASDRRVEFRGERRESFGRSVPLQLFHVFEHRYVGAQRRQRAEQKGVIALGRERLRERRGIRGIHAPLAPVSGNVLEMLELRQNGR